MIYKNTKITQEEEIRAKPKVEDVALGWLVTHNIQSSKPNRQKQEVQDSFRLSKGKIIGKNVDLKTFSTQIALQHPNYRCTFSVTYSIKDLIDLTSMININLDREDEVI